MNVKIFAIFDHCAETYLQPFFAINRGAAIRMFSNSAADENTNFFKYPNEYTLYEIGAFDDTSAEIFGTKLDRVGTALELSPKLDKPAKLPKSKSAQTV